MSALHVRFYPACALTALLTFAAVGMFAQAPVCPIGTTDSIVTTTATPQAADFPVKSTNVAAQTFTTPGTPSDCFKLGAITFSVQKHGTPGDLTLTIYSVDTATGTPLSAIPNTSAAVAAATVGTSLSDQTVTFSDPPSLVGGTRYAVVFSSGSTTGSNNYKLGVVSSNPGIPGGPYAGGQYWKNDGLWESPDGGRLDVRMTLCFTPCSGGCTLTQGYWKNHENNWPVTVLTLGTITYTQEQLLAVLGQEATGNGLVTLAHQLIAAKLNIANGADPSAISATITAADALIDGNLVPPIGLGFLAPSLTSALTDTLAKYNEGTIGPGHCAE